MKDKVIPVFVWCRVLPRLGRKRKGEEMESEQRREQKPLSSAYCKDIPLSGIWLILISAYEVC